MSNLSKVIRLYELGSTVILLGTYMWGGIWVWTEATINGLRTGNYATVVYTNQLGENGLELVLLLAFVPGVLILFVKLCRDIFTNRL